MPLLPGKKNISHNVKEMEKAGHSKKQSVAAALNEANVPKKKSKAGEPKMKKETKKHEMKESKAHEKKESKKEEKMEHKKPMKKGK